MKKILLMLLALIAMSSIAFAKIEFQELNPEYLDYMYKIQLQKFGVKNLNSLDEIQPKYDFITTFPEYGVTPEPFLLVDDLNYEDESDDDDDDPSEYPTFNAKTEGMVTGIRNQNPWGTCWAHAAIAASEHSLVSKCRYLPDSIDFSELNASWRINYGGSSLPDNKDYENATYKDRENVLAAGGQPGAFGSYYYSYLGPVAEKDCPYVEPYFIKNAQPKICASIIASFSTSCLSDFKYKKKKYEKVEKLKELIMEYGGATLSVYSSGPDGCSTIKNDYWTFYYPKELETGNAGHAICIVGWDDDFSADNFTYNPKDYLTEAQEDEGLDGTGAWLVKNSGGSYGPDEGYMWISYYQPLMGSDSYIYILGDNIDKCSFALPDYVEHETNGLMTPCNATGLSYSDVAEKDGVAEGFIVRSSTAGSSVSATITINGKSYTATSDKDYNFCNGVRTGFLSTPIPFKKGDTISVTTTTNSTDQYPSTAIPIAEPVANKFFARNQEGEWEDIGVNGWASGIKILCSEYTPVESVEVPTDTLDLTKGEEYTLVATALPYNATDRDLSYSSDNTSVATVAYDDDSESWIITAKSVGTANITVASNDYDEDEEIIQKQITVNVWNPVTSVSGVESSYTLYKGIDGYDKIVLSPSVSPNSSLQEFYFTPLSNALKVTPSEDSKTATVEIAENLGQDYGKSNKVRVTAKIKNSNLTNVNKICDFKIIVPVNELSLVSSKTVNLGEKFKLTVQIAPKNATNKNITWTSSDNDTATVDENGNVTTLKAGKVKITAKVVDSFPIGESGYEQTFESSCDLTIVSKPTSITLCSDPEKEDELGSSISMNLGQKYTVYPKLMNGTFGDEYIEPQYKEVIFTSSNRSILSVTSNGVITALRTGKAYITAKTKTNNKTCKLNITVKNYPVKGITLDETKLSLNVSESYKLGYKITPENAVDQIVTWLSDNPSVAFVDEDGVVTGINSGKANITVKTDDGGYTATCEVTVIKIPVYYVDLYKYVRNLNIGKTAQFEAKAYSRNKEIDPSITKIVWSSSNSKVATVSEDGLVTAVGNGSCYIKAACDDKSTSIKLTVATLVKSITLNKTSLSLNTGKTYKIIATVAPSNASNKKVKWTSSNSSIVSVSETGIVKALKGGTAIITCSATDGSGVKTTCKVTSIEPVKQITLNKTTLNLNVGKTFKIIATITPSNASNKKVKWSSNNSKIASVGSTGIVTGVKKGTCTITCTATDGSGVKSTCKVTIK